MSRKTILLPILVLVSAALVALEVSTAVGGGSVDRRTYTEPIRKVVVEPQDGEVELQRTAAAVTVRVKRHHLVNTPSTGQSVENGVLTLRTTCTLGFVSCRSDYRLGVPAGVDVEVRER